MYCSRERQSEQMSSEDLYFAEWQIFCNHFIVPLLTHLFNGKLDKTLEWCGEHNFILMVMVYQLQADNL